ncbi:zinc ribbon domain-containing protein [Haloarcula montana]|uniref:zinc ribbon domain-containing protein n=1 Tax=Haloarcula montana TaxID=3111776 RepID=UPI002D78AC81|nr:zinc ribbon domain-containing protein [Haloarcula sp. GH36]
MPVPPWQLGALVVALAFNCLGVYVAVRLGRAERTATADIGEDTRVDDERGDDGPAVLACPACGTENESGYRYCRECVAELPAAIAAGDDWADARGRLTR